MVGYLPSQPQSRAPLQSARGDLAIGYGWVWYAGEHAVWKITSSVPVGVSHTIDQFATNVNAAAVGAGYVWVADAGSGAVVRIDRRTNRFTVTHLGRSLGGRAVGAGRLIASDCLVADGALLGLVDVAG